MKLEKPTNTEADGLLQFRLASLSVTVMGLLFYVLACILASVNLLDMLINFFCTDALLDGDTKLLHGFFYRVLFMDLLISRPLSMV